MSCMKRKLEATEILFCRCYSSEYQIFLNILQYRYLLLLRYLDIETGCYNKKIKKV
jgi:hypothetical protein